MEKAISEKDLDIKIKILAKQINDAHRGDPFIMSLESREAGPAQRIPHLHRLVP